MNEGEIQRWSREVSRDPGSSAFVRLARAHRRQGQPDAARQVLEQGLAVHPEHMAGHALLALIHLDDGDRDRAQGEWETVLGLDPGDFGALRGLGFLALERGDLAAARQHLDGARRARPDDPVVIEALGLLVEREMMAQASADEAPEHVAPDEVPAEPAPDEDPADTRPEAEPAGPNDPARLFESLDQDAGFRGALLLDEHGLPLAGSLTGHRDPAGELLGGLLAGVSDEGRRAARILGMGEWRGLSLEADGGTVHILDLPGGTVVTTTAGDTPVGWGIRLAKRARDVARRFLEVAG
jgi:predicted regulator of Ras-like GTPase activity (Roadblock/LC7/MglB family)